MLVPSNNLILRIRNCYFSDMKGKVRVFCRLRPLSDKEVLEGERNVVASYDEFTIEHPWKDDKIKQHLYDRVFDGHASQEDVFEDSKVMILGSIIYYLFSKS